MSTRVFVAFTKAQLIHVTNILMQDEKLDNVVVSRIETDSAIEAITDKYFDLSGGVLTLRGSWRNTIEYIDSLKSVDLYIPHSLNVFTQGIQHRLSDNNTMKSLNIFPDGNLLFNNYSVPYFDMQHLKRLMLSICLSSKYRLFKGSIISPFYPIHTVASYLPEVSCSYSELLLIDMPAIEQVRGSGDGLLILGHRNQKAIEPQKIAEVIKKNNLSKNIYYKVHPRLKLKDDLFYQSLRVLYGDKVSLIADDSPAEAVLEKIAVIRVFAVASSSLITLKMLAPHLDVCYFGLEEYFGDYYNPLLKKQLISLGVQEWS